MLKAINLVRMCSDLVVVVLAWIASYYIRFYSYFDAPKGLPDSGLYFKLIPFIIGLWAFAFITAGFYRRTGKHRSAFVEALDIIQSCFFATLTFIAFTYFYDEYRYSRGTLIIFALLHPFGIITMRSTIRKTVRRLRRTNPPRLTLLIGGGPIVERALFLDDRSDIVMTRFIGIIPCGEEKDKYLARELAVAHQIPVIDKTPENWHDFLIEHKVQKVLFALPSAANQYLGEHLDFIADQVPNIQIIPDIVRYTRFSAGIENISGTPIISVHSSPLEGPGSVIKRTVDIIGSLFGLVVLGPLMVILALIVKLSSRGPIFYRQERMGLDGNPFTILKFRTMPIDAETKTGAVWATKNDNRPTPIGKWLRRTSLDELPQLYNILKGDMSIVGPRPERPVFVSDFRKKIPGYMLRHKVKAGLTGWAQVNGWRGNTSLEKRIDCDLYYIQNWSLALDIKIILLTAVRVLFHKNAY